MVFTGITSTGSNRFVGPPGSLNGSVRSLALGFPTAKGSLAAGDCAFLMQNVEGVRVADFQWGTAAAKQVVLTFQVYAPAGGEGTYAVAIRNNAVNRSWVGSYVIAANETTKFVQRSLVIPGDITGTWPKDATRSFEIDFTFATGTTFIAPTAGWNAGSFIAPPGISNGARVVGSYLIADVGLYLDDQNTGVPPPWVMPDEAQELAACQRYYCNSGMTGSLVIGGYAGNAGETWYSDVQFPTTMRGTPAVGIAGVAAANIMSSPAVGVAAAAGFRSAVGASAIGAFYGVYGFAANARM